MKARVSEDSREGIRVSEGVAGGDLRRQQSDLMFLPTSGVSGGLLFFQREGKIGEKM